MSGLAPRGGQDGVTVKIVQLGDKWSFFQSTESCSGLLKGVCQGAPCQSYEL